MKKVVQELVLFFYDLIFSLGFIVYLPFYFLRKKITIFSLIKRIGCFKAVSKKSIWVHAVSVGEVNLIEPVVDKLAESLDYSIVISTTTLTGNYLARKKYQGVAKVIFFPLDISCIIKIFLKKINPEIVIAAETELWPNLILRLKQRGIPFLIINGRVSYQAFKRYQRIRPIMKHILVNCSHIGVQNNQYRQRFINLGARPEQLSITGNLKFNSIKPNKEKIEEVKKKYISILKPSSRELFVAASTHDPEEKIILNIYQELCLEKSLTLLLAPRHPERIASIEKDILAKGFRPIRISKISQLTYGKKDVFILDTVGELLYFYSICDICFVGGTLSGSGGHNILEPIYFLKPVLFGPSMENFSDIAGKVLQASAGILVKSPQQLKEKLKILLEDKGKRIDYAEAATDIFKEADSLGKNFKMILEGIKRCL
ncbi:MAG: 3-deoxy-D-manno-octulosonic acid transferase [Candidatus Omnitrophica bacterium]|nr:3-deoxy-D-manno-octulosonic acid transferase [Candidatus Omnitrophota bacterium]MCF7893532.1 3-deoxy-D-manno-octulosonic acid transferase [Candidatus Omnitrophota bacterium]